MSIKKVFDQIFRQIWKFTPILANFTEILEIFAQFMRKNETKFSTHSSNLHKIFQTSLISNEKINWITANERKPRKKVNKELFSPKKGERRRGKRNK